MENSEKLEPRKVQPTAVPDEAIGKALIACKGLQYIAADMLGISDSTVSLRIQQSPYLQQIRDACLQRRLDRAELKLDKLIDVDENLGAICFFLKTIGKIRGYTESAPTAIPAETNDLLKQNMVMLKGCQDALKKEETIISSD